MSTHHQVQPIANLHQRKSRWWREVRDQVFFTLPVMAIALLIVSWILGLLVDSALVKDGVPPDTPIFQILNYSLIERAVLMLPVGLLLSIPVIFVVAGRYPSESDVLRDQSLRRAYGMSDAVEPDIHS